ncbi:MAG TPA: hypothetical protein VMD27_08190 [Candidatus Aquilonibacter sp.]|nr:hypothetical protein [Candidatus Aquilonibacter sp.]
MKNPRFLICATAALIGLLAAASFGCKKKESPSAGQNPPQSPMAGGAMPAAGTPSSPAFVSVEKTSFNEVTSQLDPGGDFYLYLSTAQWLENLSAKVSHWQQAFESMPDMNGEDRANVDKAFGVAARLIKDSGIEDVTGVGMSSIEIEPGLYRNKALLHHYPGKGTGFLWNFLGKQPHPLAGLDMLPSNTALAVFSDMDAPLLWSVAQQEVAESDFPQAQELMQKLPAKFEQQTQIKWDDFLNSLGGEFGFVLTLDDDNKIPIPLPPSGAAEIPEPGLLIVIKVNDDTIFNRLDQVLKQNPQVISVDNAGLKMRTIPVPIPFIGELRPTAATGGGYLFIASSDDLVNEVLAVKSGKTPGLQSTAEFKRLSQNIPDQGNQFTFVSQRFSQTMFQIQQQAMNAAAARDSSPAQAQWMQSLFSQKPMFTYSVGINTDNGCLTVGNSSQSYAYTATILPAVAVVGMMAAIAIPNFEKARETAQRNACINNLRQIDAAKEQWALENGKKVGDVPTKDDLLPYLPSWPVCPSGGTYSINAIGENPTCSIPGHELP